MSGARPGCVWGWGLGLPGGPRHRRPQVLPAAALVSTGGLNGACHPSPQPAATMGPVSGTVPEAPRPTPLLLHPSRGCCSSLSLQTAGYCRAGPGHAPGTQCGCLSALSPCAIATREWALLGAALGPGAGCLSVDRPAHRQGRGSPKHRTALNTGVGSKPTDLLCPQPGHRVQVPGDHL